MKNIITLEAIWIFYIINLEKLTRRKSVCWKTL